MNARFASPLPSKCGTLYLPISTGMRLPGVTNSRVSSSVDHTTCLTPASSAACAIVCACTSSLVGERCSQKLVTQKAPCAPSIARRTLTASSRSATTISAPASASARAAGESGLRVTARTRKRCCGSARIARANPPPCAPVAPNTVMIRDIESSDTVAIGHRSAVCGCASKGASTEGAIRHGPRSHAGSHSLFSESASRAV